jgi:hypothetical protein
LLPTVAPLPSPTSPQAIVSYQLGSKASSDKSTLKHINNMAGIASTMAAGLLVILYYLLLQIGQSTAYFASDCPPPIQFNTQPHSLGGLVAAETTPLLLRRCSCLLPSVESHRQRQLCFLWAQQPLSTDWIASAAPHLFLCRLPPPQSPISKKIQKKWSPFGTSYFSSAARPKGGRLPSFSSNRLAAVNTCWDGRNGSSGQFSSQPNAHLDCWPLSKHSHPVGSLMGSQTIPNDPPSPSALKSNRLVLYEQAFT